MMKNIMVAHNTSPIHNGMIANSLDSKPNMIMITIKAKYFILALTISIPHRHIPELFGCYFLVTYRNCEYAIRSRLKPN